MYFINNTTSECEASGRAGVGLVREEDLFYNYVLVIVFIIVTSIHLIISKKF